MSVAARTPNGGTPPAARNIPPSAVTSSSDMIAGFVSVMRSPTSWRWPLAARDATVARATMLHQRSDAAAGCAPRAQGEKPLSGFAAPIATCAMKIAAVATASGPRPADHDREHRERREEQLGVREVDRHPLGRELEHDGDRAEHRLQGVKHRGDEGDREHAPIGAVDDDRPHDHRGNREPGDDREEAMRPLDTSRRVERRQELAVAKRPIGTPEARAGYADDAAPDHDEERRQQAHVDDRAIARRKTHPMRLRPKPRGASARRLP